MNGKVHLLMQLAKISGVAVAQELEAVAHWLEGVMTLGHNLN